MILRVRTMPDPILRKVALPVIFPSEPTLQALVADMRDTMYKAAGIGLAAPQIGTSLRIILAGDRALANPIMTMYGHARDVGFEGCLSLPDVSPTMVMRPKRIVVTAIDLDTLEPVTIAAKGMEARVLQHEIDHLDGVLITDRKMWSWSVHPEIKS